LGGGLVKTEWFKRYHDSDKPERFDRIVQSWDTANKATELSDYSVCTTWGVKGKHLFLIGLFRRRLEYPALKRAVREQQTLFNASVVLIEDKASGTQLIQDLIAESCHGVTRYQPTDEKTMRMHAQTAVIENGFVHLPETARGLPNTFTSSPCSRTASMTIRPIQPPSSSIGLKGRSQARAFTNSTAGTSKDTNGGPDLGSGCRRRPASAPCKPCTHANTSLSASTALSKCGPKMPNT
jgi:predicted phage terminase large subunit-like protein